MLNGSGLGLTFSLRLGNIQSAESTWSTLNSEVETCVLPTLEGNRKGTKTSSHYPLSSKGSILSQISTYFHTHPQ